MYNRYIPRDAHYGPIPPEERASAGAQSGRGVERPRPGGLSGLLDGLFRPSAGETGGIGQTLSSLLKGFHLDDLDTGDVLLALIVLLLILEDGDNLDLVITLGLMILFSLGEP